MAALPGTRVIDTGAALSPGGLVSLRPVDLAAQEDARAIRWTGEGALSIDGPTADMSRQLNNAFALRLDLRIDALGGGAASVAVDNVALDATGLWRSLPVGQLRTIRIPLRCFADRGTKLTAVGSAVRISGAAGLALTLRSARVEAVGEPLACPPPVR